MTDYQTILVERAATDSRVGIITLNRPAALNALNRQLMAEVVVAALAFDVDPEVGAIVITGSDRAFAAGADIKELQSRTFPDVYNDDLFRDWDRLADVRIPIIAAVAGHALGGGCELAMVCDFIIAADNAKFGQPEIRLGVIPGFGGTQRLTRAVGKAKAMDLVLTGRLMPVDEAERSGLVSRVVPLPELLPAAIKTASTIAAMSAPIAMMAKEAVNRSFESSLAEGLRFERRLNHSTFGTADQKEGMAAFSEKRTAQFAHK
jgi:enoyl-CoA hydratase